ncbi:non-ribosomal peptide synthetase, partial [Nakamurella leprariae]
MTSAPDRPAAVLDELVVPGPTADLADRLDAVTAARPDAEAVTSPGESWTYAEVTATARRWARALRGHLADEPADRPVALAVEPTASAVVALLAVILSGRPVVPVDPMLPVERAALIRELSGGVPMDVAEVRQLGETDGAPEADLPTAGIDDPAVIFFTSGSTGRPKGLVHSHGAWLNQAYETRLALDLTPDDRLSLILPVSFGAGLDVLFMGLLNGATVCVYDPRVLGVGGLHAWLQEQRVTTVHGTPALLRAVLDHLPDGAPMKGVRLVTSCGEAIHSSQVEAIRARLDPGGRFTGVSGASEIGNLAFHRLDPDRPVPVGLLPVGRPAANKTIEVVDEAGVPVVVGATGEVAITSRFLARGYFGDPEQTAARFVRHPDGTTTYRGGDLGRWDADGVLHLLGRADAAVKVGGYLVEPAEVEAALLAFPEIREAVVSAVRPTDAVDGARTRLLAHVVPVETNQPVTPASVRRALRDRLPSWMVPAEVVMVPALPRNERGKIDRRALPTPPAPAAVDPAPGTETVIAAVWAQVLGLDRVGATDDFWALGGDSLAVEEMLAGVGTATGVGITTADAAATATVRELAALVDTRAGAAARVRTDVAGRLGRVAQAARAPRRPRRGAPSPQPPT